MELSRQLAEQLVALEQQAVQVAVLLDGAPPELVEQVLAAFAPLPPIKDTGAKQRAIWGRTWLAWIADCGERYEQRPSEPTAEDLRRVLLRWVCQ